MSIYSLKCRTLQRSKGHSSVGIGAYMQDANAIDPWTGKKHHQDGRHTHRIDIIGFSHSDEFPFENSIDVFAAVDAYEKRKDAVLGEEYEIALQYELTEEQNTETVKNFCKQAADEGKILVAAIHWQEGNPHVHIFESPRSYMKNSETGEFEWGKKENKKASMRDRIERRREHWEQCVNQEFEKAWLDLRIDHRSNEERGINVLPEIHEGKNPSLAVLEHNSIARKQRIEYEREIASRAEIEIAEIKFREKEIEIELQKLISSAEVKMQIPEVQPDTIKMRFDAPLFTLKNGLAAPAKRSKDDGFSPAPDSTLTPRPTKQKPPEIISGASPNPTGKNWGNGPGWSR